MDSTPDDDPADELLGLAGQLRGQLRRHSGLGAWAAPGGATLRPAADATPTEVFDEALIPLGRRSLAQIRADLGECTRCKLHTTRNTIVFGVGSETAPLMFVGEAPGEQEDKRGEPFVGPAGELLDKMIEAMGWSRRSVYIANTTKCLRYNALVQLGDGSWERIGRLVRSKYSGTVMSVDDDGTLVPKQVTGWHTSPLGDRRVYRLTYAGAKAAGATNVGIQLTGDHPVLTDSGYVAVENLRLDAQIATGFGVSGAARDVIFGTLLGDGHIAAKSSSLQFSHSEKQEEYALFKARILAELSCVVRRYAAAARSGGEAEYPVVAVRTKASRYLRQMRGRFYGVRKRVPPQLRSELTARMVAIWFLDDGYLRIRPPRNPAAEIATCSFDTEGLEILLQGLRNLGVSGTAIRGRIHFSTIETRNLSKLIARYVPTSMRYKLCPDIAAELPYDADLWEAGMQHVEFERVVAEPIEFSGTDKTFYCIDVADTHNFVTAGGVVHNCRPPGNRDPQADELAQCIPFLEAQIASIAPRIIVTLGKPAANQVLGTDAPISALRGVFHERFGAQVMPTFHPAYLLRDPNKKREVWSDLKLVMAELDRLGITPTRG